ncbi:FHA domain-containing protein [Mycolicibacterium sp. GF69]|uniref:FHA domain-containing protein n=1 Tax=Mycolicibacterium sp. GF69 TaxID=2267251 RepID=UPI001057C8EA|nr:FHA domain-containing protein [Mycolicibacterium sp. GF69]
MHEGRSAGPAARQGEPATLTVHVAGGEYTAHPGDGAVTIGRELPAQIRVAEPGISRMHVRLEPAGGHWMLTDTGSRNGVYFEGRRIASVAVDRELDVYLGNPEGVLMRLRPAAPAGTAQSSTDTFGPAVVGSGDTADAADDDTVDSAVGDPVPEEEEPTEAITPTVQVAITIDAAEIALRGIYARIAMLPMGDDPQFAAQAAALLAELRRLEATLTNAAEKATGRPELAITLGEVRQTYTELMRRTARSPSATLGQRLYAARHQCQLTVQETANAAGVAVEDVANVEAEHPVPDPVAATVERFVDVVARDRDRP